MRDLQESGLCGRLPNFMSFKIRMGNLLSSNYEQEAAVPQGSILSTTLFILELTTPYMLMIYLSVILQLVWQLLQDNFRGV